jgi:sugar lactone lactonase YvrE
VRFRHLIKCKVQGSNAEDDSQRFAFQSGCVLSNAHLHVFGTLLRSLQAMNHRQPNRGLSNLCLRAVDYINTFRFGVSPLHNGANDMRIAYSRAGFWIRSGMLALAIVAATASGLADIVYVSNWNNDTILKFDSDTGANLGVFATPYHPRGIATDSLGNVYAIAWGTQTIMKYTPAGVGSVFATGLQGGETLTVDSHDNLYVGNLWNHTIMRYTPQGASSLFASTGGEMYGLAFDPAGNLYASIFYSGTIERFAPDGTRSTFASGLVNPTGLAFDSAGDLYASDWATANIHRYTPNGADSIFLQGSTSGIKDPEGLAFDSADNLYVADTWGGPNYGRVERFTHSGTGSVLADIYYGGPVSIAVFVPEPSVAALLISGCLAFAAFARQSGAKDARKAKLL